MNETAGYWRRQAAECRAMRGAMLALAKTYDCLVECEDHDDYQALMMRLGVRYARACATLEKQTIRGHVGLELEDR